ncbi:MAG: carboxypeptidase-like regulatory domain-containing protein, partial [Gemmatimonadales bacterium]
MFIQTKSLELGMGTRRFLLLTAAVFATSAQQVAAQTVIKGSVRGNGRVLPAADVRLDPDGVSVRTDSSGTYRLTAAKGGVVRLSVRAVGFYPASRNILVVANDTVTNDFVLDPVAQQLDSISVEAAGVAVRGKMSAFEERRQSGIGRFYTREMLAKRDNSTTADVVRMTAALRLIRRPDSCGGGYAVATGRGGAVRWEDWMICSGSPMVAACYFAIYLDGMRQWIPGQREPPDINKFQPHTLQGI